MKNLQGINIKSFKCRSIVGKVTIYKQMYSGILQKNSRLTYIFCGNLCAVSNQHVSRFHQQKKNCNEKSDTTDFEEEC